MVRASFSIRNQMVETREQRVSCQCSMRAGDEQEDEQHSFLTLFTPSLQVSTFRYLAQITNSRT